MNELTLDGKVYVSSKRAAEITGYAKDYVGQLCREGHVEARLVGRNWYVLESSIREHRFGPRSEGSVVTSAKEMPTTWEAPRYESETPAYIAPISTREATAPVPVAPNEPVMSDMQTAWQEWFEKKQVEPVAPLPEPVPVEEESVAIHITPIDQEGEQEVAEERSEEASNFIEEASEEETRGSEETEDEELTEDSRAPRVWWRPGNLVLQSIFVGIALIAVTISIIGTGFAERISGKNIYRLPEINLISGVSVYNR
jgi:hypothetical protein